jgi:hypothetical protein
MKNETSIVMADPLLSEADIASEKAVLPVFSDLFGLCLYGRFEIWSDQRRLACHQTSPSLPPVSPGRI